MYCEYRHEHRIDPVLKGYFIVKKTITYKSVFNLMSNSEQCCERKEKQNTGIKYDKKLLLRMATEKVLLKDWTSEQWFKRWEACYINVQEKSICGRGNSKVRNFEMQKCFAYLWKIRSLVWLYQRGKGNSVVGLSPKDIVPCHMETCKPRARILEIILIMKRRYWGNLSGAVLE